MLALWVYNSPKLSYWVLLSAHSWVNEKNNSGSKASFNRCAEKVHVSENKLKHMYMHVKCTRINKYLTSMAAVIAWWSGVTGRGGRRLGGGGLVSPSPTLNAMPPDAIDASCSKTK